MSNIVPLRSRKQGEMWAVIAFFGKKKVIASIYSSLTSAQDDCLWRQQQVKHYATFLKNAQQPAPTYIISPLSRSELPSKWRPLPALGFIHGKF